MSRLLVLLALIICINPALAQTFSGVASVIDGDTIEIHGQRIRIHGIDAPESWQMCCDAHGKNYRCGQQAAFALDDFLKARRPVACHQTDIDRYDRVVGRCSAGGLDIAAWMVESGHALDWTRYSKGEYAGPQNSAQAARRGIWRGQFQRPWERRRNKDAMWVGS